MLALAYLISCPSSGANYYHTLNTSCSLYKDLCPTSDEQGDHHETLLSSMAHSRRPMPTEHVTISFTVTGNLMKLCYIHVSQPHISYILTLLIPSQNGHIPIQDSHSQIDGTLECERRHVQIAELLCCLLYTSPSPRDGLLSRMPSSA